VDGGLRSSEVLAMWKVVGPRNETLRATVSLEHCLPVSEETVSLAHGMCTLSSFRSLIDVLVTQVKRAVSRQLQQLSASLMHHGGIITGIHHHHVACPMVDVAVPTSLLHACRF